MYPSLSMTVVPLFDGSTIIVETSAKVESFVLHILNSSSTTVTSGNGHGLESIRNQVILTFAAMKLDVFIQSFQSCRSMLKCKNMTLFANHL